jgi:hypothetical protein
VCLQSCCPPHTRLPPGTHTPPCAPTPSFVPMQALIQAMGGPLLSHSIHVPSIDMSEDEYLVPDTGRHTGRWLVTWLPGWCIRQCYSVSVCVHASWPDIVGHVLVHHVRSIMSGVLPPPPSPRIGSVAVAPGTVQTRPCAWISHKQAELHQVTIISSRIFDHVQAP